MAEPAPTEPETGALPALLPAMRAAGSAEAATRQQARQLYDRLTAAGQPVTGAALGPAIGRSERYSRLPLAEFRTATGQEVTRNGKRPAAGPPTT
jgi:hypothetical protein